MMCNRKGQYRFPYNGDNKHKAIVNFMRDPTSQMVKKEPVDESWSTDSDVIHLTGNIYLLLKFLLYVTLLYYYAFILFQVFICKFPVQTYA